MLRASVLLLAIFYYCLNFTVLQAQSSSRSYACPDCTFDNPEKFICEQGLVAGAEATKVCVGVESGLKSCFNKNRFVTPISAANVSEDSLNCGACGNLCFGDKNRCVNGECSCRPGECNNSTTRCDRTKKECVLCPTGFNNCNSFTDTGSNGDCETPVTSDVLNCGGCGIKCPPGHTCQNGVCKCGSSEECTYPTDICSNGKCVECSDPTEDSTRCSKVSIYHNSTFCSKSKKCDKCPTGMADCLATNLTGDPDTGNSGDCETNMAAVMGRAQHCGTCGTFCDAHNGMTCCSGKCTCGKFANPLIPTTAECAAGSVCSSTEYCDQRLGKCMPSGLFGENCRGNSGFSGVVDGRLNSGLDDNRITCGSCFRNESNKNVVFNRCQANNQTGCGESQVKCRIGQTCVRGKCRCSLFSMNTVFSWQPALNVDPDNDNKFSVTSKPADGCNSNLLFSNVQGAFDRGFQTLFRFVECAIKSRNDKHNLDQVTLADFKDESFREKVCPGGLDRCPKLFCDELERNFTGDNRNHFCGTAFDAFGRGKSCAQNWKLAGETEGDLLCANEFAQAILDSQANQFGMIDLFNFMGCDQEHDKDLPISLNGLHPQHYPFRVETAIKFMASASLARPSTILLGVVALGTMVVLSF